MSLLETPSQLDIVTKLNTELPFTAARVIPDASIADRYSVFLQERIKNERAEKEEARKYIEYYPYFLGTYCEPFTLDSGRGSVLSSLSLREIEIAAYINNLEYPDGANVLDFGGGAGLSTIRIANRFAKYVEAGSMTFNVSNLAMLPDLSPDDTGLYGIPKVVKAYDTKREQRRDEKDLILLQSMQHYVSYLQADALELYQLMTLAMSGRAIPLHGSLDIIHEKFAIMYSHIPDIAINILYEMLRPGGTFLLSTISAYSRYFEISQKGGELEPEENGEYGMQIDFARAVGQQHILEKGAVVTDIKPYWIAYTKPRA